MLEEQEQQLSRRRKQIELEPEIAASTAKIAILEASDSKSVSQAPSHGIHSYLERKSQKDSTFKNLNTMAKEYEPLAGSTLRHRKEPAEMQNYPLLLGARPKEPSKQFTINPRQDAHVNNGYQDEPCVHKTTQHALSVHLHATIPGHPTTHASPS